MIAYYGWRLSHDLKKKGKEERDKKKEKEEKKTFRLCIIKEERSDLNILDF